MKNQTIFYHYCGVDVLLSVLKNEALRLLDIEKSNDYTERKWMMNKIKEEFLNLVSQNISKGHERLVNEFSRLEKEFEILDNVYASCFSTDGDLLSQWRAYGQNGFGAAIGFSGEILKKINSYKDVIEFQPIVYDCDKQKEYGRCQANKILNLLQNNDNLFHAMSEVFAEDLKNLCCFKNPAFSEEKEWRLCISLSPENRKTLKEDFDPFVLSEIKLDSNQKRIFTYLDLNFTKVKNDIVKEIILGPQCQISGNDIRQTLSVLGYEASGIGIKKSKATYT